MRNRRALGSVMAVLWSLLPGPALTAELTNTSFLGPESCKSCHPDAYSAWRQSKHARALESLSEQQQKDARCLSCHSPNLADRRVESVTCESCHGGGQYYAAQYVMKDPELSRLVGLLNPSEKGCRSCHDASSPSLKPFDFVEKLKLVDHWTVERQKKEQALAAAAQPPSGKPKQAPKPAPKPPKKRP